LAKIRRKSRGKVPVGGGGKNGPEDIEKKGVGQKKKGAEVVYYSKTPKCGGRKREKKGGFGKRLVWLQQKET